MAAQVAVVVDASSAQDALRPYRNFINLLAGVANDQSYANTDNAAYSNPYGYQTIGPDGAAVEGTTLYNMGYQTGSNIKSKLITWGLIGAVVYVLMK